MPTIFQLTPNDHDQLRELINIGVSHAGNTLSKMMGKRITISVPAVDVTSAETASEFVDHGEEITVAVLLRISGGIEGYVFMFFPRNAALHLLKVLSGKTIGDLRALDTFDRSMFQELGNVITGGMLQELSKFLHIEMMHSVPDVVIDMGGAMFNSITASMIHLHEEFLSLDVAVCVDANAEEIYCEGLEASVGRMFLFIGPEATDKILAITNAMLNKTEVA